MSVGTTLNESFRGSLEVFIVSEIIYITYYLLD